MADSEGPDWHTTPREHGKVTTARPPVQCGATTRNHSEQNGKELQNSMGQLPGDYKGQPRSRPREALPYLVRPHKAGAARERHIDHTGAQRLLLRMD